MAGMKPPELSRAEILIVGRSLGLTDGQASLLALIYRHDASDKEIACARRIAVCTVRTHIGTIIEKLSVHSRTGAAIAFACAAAARLPHRFRLVVNDDTAPRRKPVALSV